MSDRACICEANYDTDTGHHPQCDAKVAPVIPVGSEVEDALATAHEFMETVTGWTGHEDDLGDALWAVSDALAALHDRTVCPDCQGTDPARVIPATTTCADCPVPWSEAHAEAVLAERERWEKGLRDLTTELREAAHRLRGEGTARSGLRVRASARAAGVEWAAARLTCELDEMTGAGE